MKKGFTLIELLAVIVILAIIALIATPIVLNIINDTKESAALRSADFYLDGVGYFLNVQYVDEHFAVM
jgi:type IV pilus assembly protein PilA